MPSRVVTKRRVKRRQQRLVSKNVKRKGRTVRTLRKHRKSVKKVMRGGEPPIIHEIFLANNNVSPVITLTISLPKGIFSSTYTFNIEINLDLYKGDVRKLLKILFESGGGLVDFDPNDEKIRSRFLLGLADIPEQDGTIDWAVIQADEKGVIQSMIDDIKNKANQAKSGRCFIEMEANKGSFTVKKYSQISYNTTDVVFNRHCTNNDRNEGYCAPTGMVRIRETLYYPVLNPEGKNNFWGRFDFINWSSKTNPVAYSDVKNKCTFSVKNTTKDMSSFVEKLKIYTILNLDGQDAKDLAAKDLAAPKLP